MGNVDDINQFFSTHQNMDLNFKSTEGSSPLSLALRRNDQLIVDAVLKNGASPYIFDDSLFRENFNWYSQNILRKIQEMPKSSYTVNDLEVTTGQYADLADMLAQTYAKMTDELGAALRSGSVDKLRQFHLKNNLTCNQFAEMGIQAVEFQAMDVPTDEKLDLLKKYYYSVDCPRRATSDYGVSLYSSEWKRLLLKKFDSAKVLNFIATLFIITRYDLFYGNTNSDSLIFNPYILIATESEDLRNRFVKDFFEPLAIPTKISLKIISNGKEQDKLLDLSSDESKYEVSTHLDFITMCVLSPNRQCNYLDDQNYFNHNPDLDDYYQNLNKED